MRRQATFRDQTAAKPTITPITSGVLQRQCACGQHMSAGGECKECKQKREGTLQRSAINLSQVKGVPPIVHDVLRSPGQPLDAGTRGLMEPRFGHDFSQVRVHTDAQGAESAHAVGSLAYTVGKNIVFGSGQYTPNSNSGRKLLAHELTHVVQQSSITSDLTNLTVGDPNNSYEREADTHKNWDGDQQIDKSVTKPVIQRVSHPVVMRSPLFSSTIEICHRLLESREFTVAQGGLTVGIEAFWEGPTEGGTSCESHRNKAYNVTLNQKGVIFDSEYGTCEFDPQRLSTRIWTGLPSDEYSLTIWTNNTNPNCCLKGTIDVAEDSGLTGDSCTKIPDDALTILHSALDLAGLIPALGAIPDGINAAIYSIQGDWTNAGLSAAAMVPVFGEGVTVTKLGVKVTRAAIKKTGKEALVVGLKEAKAARTVAKIGKKIAETRGLAHSFDRHAHEWFGIAKEAISKERHLPQWQSLLERTAESKKVFTWKLGNDEVTGHLAYFQGAIGDVTLKQGRHFAIFFFNSGPRVGEVASAFVPDPSQLAQMINLVK